MNKLIAIIICLSFPVIVSAQAIQAKQIEASLGLGFGIYGLGTNIPDDDGDVALPGLFNLKAQFAIARWVSAGLMFERNGFLTDPDSSEHAKSNNFYLSFTFRPVIGEKTVLYTNLDIGLSSEYSYDHEREDIQITSSGGAFQLGLGIKHFISDHVGISYEAAMAAYSYDKLETNKGDVLQILNDEGEFENLVIGMAGVNHRLGITYKF